MKKLLALFIACAAFIMAGCALKPQLTGKMQLDEVELTNRETAIAQAAGGANSFTAVYKFMTDGRCKAINYSTYELVDGAWQMVAENGGINLEHTERDGILALSFVHLEDEVVNVAVTTKNGSGAITYEKPYTIAQQKPGNGRTTTLLRDKNVLEYDTPIAVAMQTLSENSMITSHNVSQFSAPENISLEDGERLLALAVTFSTRALE